MRLKYLLLFVILNTTYTPNPSPAKELELVSKESRGPHYQCLSYRFIDAPDWCLECITPNNLGKAEPLIGGQYSMSAIKKLGPPSYHLKALDIWTFAEDYDFDPVTASELGYSLPESGIFLNRCSEASYQVEYTFGVKHLGGCDYLIESKLNAHSNIVFSSIYIRAASSYQQQIFASDWSDTTLDSIPLPATGKILGIRVGNKRFDFAGAFSLTHANLRDINSGLKAYIRYCFYEAPGRH